MCLTNRSLRLGPNFRAEVSFAKRYDLSDVQLGKSFINIRKSVGPSKLPWMTDMSTGLAWE